MPNKHYLGIKEFLRDGECRVFLSFVDKDTEGTSEGNEIFLNIDLLVAHTFIHEFLHAKDRDMSEENVEILTDKIMNSLSDEECRKLGRRVLKLARRKKYPKNEST